jgi:archaellum component FlaC
MSLETEIEFVKEMSRYFQKKAAKSKEDIDYWSCVSNSENCDKIVERLESLDETLKFLEENTKGIKTSLDSLKESINRNIRE